MRGLRERLARRREPSAGFFRGKVAAVTGAGSGIGRALALRLAADGCHLALSDVNEAGLVETVGLARATGERTGARVTCSLVDVADRGTVYRWADAVVEEHGKVNLVINNAGVSLGATVEGGSDEDFEWLFGINFWGVVHGTRAFLPHLRASGDGHVVNVSSVFGLVAFPGNGAYNASKAAVRALTDALRMELEMGRAPVGATCVFPGGINTNIARSARMDASLRSIGYEAEEGQSDGTLVTDADDVAAATLHGVEKNRRRVLVGDGALLLDGISRFLPGAYQSLMKRSAVG